MLSTDPRVPRPEYPCEALVPAAGSRVPTAADVRAHVAAELGPYAAPRQVLVLDALPLVGVGKPDRAAVARLAAAG